VLALLAVAVVPVARQPGKVGHDGISRLCEAIEQRGFPNVRTPHEGDNWLH